MTVYQGGGVFVSTSLPYHSLEDQALQAINRDDRRHGYGARRHSCRVICGAEDGQYYFLEIAARVGGAGIDQLVQYATNVNPWVEWARLEVADLRGEEYSPATRRARPCRAHRHPGAPGMA